VCGLYANTVPFYIRDSSSHRIWYGKVGAGTSLPQILRYDCIFNTRVRVMEFKNMNQILSFLCSKSSIDFLSLRVKTVKSFLAFYSPSSCFFCKSPTWPPFLCPMFQACSILVCNSCVFAIGINENNYKVFHVVYCSNLYF
jgi:hypothetical protein